MIKTISMLRQSGFLLFTFCLLILLLQYSSGSAQSLGNGSDGSPSVSGIINAYTPLVETTSSCSRRITVGDASLFHAGDLVLIIQMQGAEIDLGNSSSYGTINSYANAGNYEYAHITTVVSSTVLELQNNLQNSYDLPGKVQVVRVPQYNQPVISGTLTCKAWDGSTGGILALDATGTIDLQSDMDVSAKGFRGGPIISGVDFITDTNYFDETPSIVANGPKGEGIAFYGADPFTSGRGAPANGGGGGNSHTGGGAGGSNYGCGGNGGWGYPITADYQSASGIGGHALSYSGSSKIFMGGGGGSGSIHANEGTAGANGGGIIVITCNTLLSNGGNLLSSGDSSLSGGSPLHSDGIGGAGAGGTVLIAAVSITGNVPVTVIGGNGGSPSLIGAGPGGGGGGGICMVTDPTLLSSVTLNAAGGLSGNIHGNVYGSANGCPGGITSGLVIPVSNVLTGTQAEFTFVTTNPAGNQIGFSNSSINADVYHWDFGDGTSDSSFSPSHTYTSSGIYPVMLTASDFSGCADSIEQIIITGTGNIFTPNNDGKNDYFSFPNHDKGNYQVQFTIFDRWGKEVFKGDDTHYRWDGTLNGTKVKDGTYYYIIEITDLSKGTKTVKQDWLSLTR